MRVSKPSRRSVLLTLLLQYIQLSILSLNGNTEKRQGKRGVLITRPYEHMLLLAAAVRRKLFWEIEWDFWCVCVVVWPPCLLTTADSLAVERWVKRTSIGSNTNCNGDGNCLFFGIFCARQQIGNGSQFGTTVWVGPQLLIAVRSLWALISIAWHGLAKDTTKLLLKHDGQTVN